MAERLLWLPVEEENMKIALAGFLVGALGNFATGPSVLPEDDPVDTCTPAVVCQVTSQISGSWTVGGAGVSTGGSCVCVDQSCLTKHCKVDITVTCTGGGSYRLTGTGPCTDGQPSKQLTIKSCGGVAAAMYMIYQGTGCTGTSVWHTYHVQCGDGPCGDFKCPPPPPPAGG